ncbi:MAG TPA: caspase family protein [Saprospiraceae bacterium]|nr:caspase family protein [Saprospiraceae bacterium]
MPTLHALLVGINAYPNPNHVLRGCVNDVQHLHKYLEAYCRSMGYTYRPLLLTDVKATRQAVIDGFEHFQAAEASDCCLFHFSGHGARSAAPEAFWGLEPDHQLESMVCWDSRRPGGHDLMDKELSYLIWQASQGKDLPFITIMDCCHSGDMRNATEYKHDLKLDVLGVRALRDAGSALPAEQFLGIEHYKKTNNGQLTPPLGRRVHLAAARNVEYAKELIAGGEPRGIFTYCLIEALEATGPLVTYADLLNRVNLRLNNVVKEQSAQLGATFTEDRNLGFLFSQSDAEHPAYLVSWDKAMDSWTVNAGALHGIPEGDAGSRTILELKDNKHLVQVENVLPNRSKVSGMEGYDAKRSYVATIKRRAIPKLTLAFSRGSDPKGVTLLSDLIRKQSCDLFQLRDQMAGNGYLIHAGNDEYFLTRTHDDSSLFEPENGFNEASASAFLKKLEKVANWQQVLELQNQDTGIRDSEIYIQLFRLTEARREEAMDNDVPVEPVDWEAGPAIFSYFQKDGEFLKPALQLKLRNTGHRTLWVSLLYLGNDFSMTNALLPKQGLGPGEEVWASDVVDGYAYRTIPLQIEADKLAAIDEYLKVFICTEELNTDMYLQKGLAADTDAHRTIGFRQQPKEKDWATKTVGVRVERE